MDMSKNRNAKDKYRNHNYHATHPCHQRHACAYGMRGACGTFIQCDKEMLGACPMLHERRGHYRDP